jgi:hypothetical protein
VKSSDQGKASEGGGKVLITPQGLLRPGVKSTQSCGMMGSPVDTASSVEGKLTERVPDVAKHAQVRD